LFVAASMTRQRSWLGPHSVRDRLSALDYDDPARALPLAMTEAQRRGIFQDNAKRVYRV
jgi:hypothetical protein